MVFYGKNFSLKHITNTTGEMVHTLLGNYLWVGHHQLTLSTSNSSYNIHHHLYNYLEFSFSFPFFVA